MLPMSKKAATCSEEDDYSSAPWNFSWVVRGELAAMAHPQTPANLRFLVREGIRHLVTLSPEKRPPIHAFPEILWHEIKVKEFEAPSLTQIQRFLGICEAARAQGEAVGVHCRMGRGRTGVMLACYLVRFCEQSPDRAMINLRLMRPGSVETSQQERVVRTYHDYHRTKPEK